MASLLGAFARPCAGPAPPPCGMVGAVTEVVGCVGWCCGVRGDYAPSPMRSDKRGGANRRPNATRKGHFTRNPAMFGCDAGRIAFTSAACVRSEGGDALMDDSHSRNPAPMSAPRCTAVAGAGTGIPRWSRKPKSRGEFPPRVQRGRNPPGWAISGCSVHTAHCTGAHSLGKRCGKSLVGGNPSTPTRLPTTGPDVLCCSNRRMPGRVKVLPTPPLL